MKRIRKSFRISVEEYLSPKLKKMLQKIWKNINYIKEPIMDITKMNGLYLEDKAKKTFLKRIK